MSPDDAVDLETPMSEHRGQVVDGDALLRLSVRPPGGGTRTESAVVDTGFRGEISLPSSLSEAARRGRAQRSVSRLADGSPVRHRSAVVEIVFCGERRFVPAGDGSDHVLIGTALLHGRRLTVDAVEGGAVTIGPLSQSSPDVP